MWVLDGFSLGRVFSNFCNNFFSFAVSCIQKVNLGLISYLVFDK